MTEDRGLDRFQALGGLIEEAESAGLLVEPDGLTGYSGRALTGALQRFAHLSATRGWGSYLEVGVFQGLTLLSVAAAQDGPSVGIDNFSQFDPDGANAGLVELRRRKNNLVNAAVIDEDYEVALESLGDRMEVPVGVYFVDGPHDYRSQLMCLLLALPWLSPDAVIVVDDANYRHVRMATRDFLVTHPEWALLYEAYTPCHPKNMSLDALETATQGWWNGVNIMVRDLRGDLERVLPSVLASRLLYENEHVVHAARLAAAAPEALSLVEHVLAGADTAPALQGLTARLATIPKALIGAHPAMNTFSANLPTRAMNPALRD